MRTEALPCGAVEVACTGTAVIGGAIWLPLGHGVPGITAMWRLPGANGG